jgi:hypothetical protein
MNKRTESLIDTKMENNSPASPSTKHSISPETLEYMRETEALEWTQRFNKKVSEQGINTARNWWYRTISEIERIRGVAAADELRARMNRIRNANRHV